MLRTCLILACLFLASDAHARSYESTELHVAFDVPDEFSPFNERMQSSNTLFSFVSTNRDGSFRFSIAVQRLRGVVSGRPIEQQTLDALQQQLPTNSLIRTFESDWEEFLLEGIEITSGRDDSILVSRTLQLPLMPEAIQIVALGKEHDEKDVANLLQTVVDSVKSTTRRRVLSEGTRSGLRFLTWMAGIAAGIMIIVTLLLRSEKSP